MVLELRKRGFTFAEIGANLGMNLSKEVKPMARKRRESISSLVPNDDAQVALLIELCKAQGKAETAYIVDCAMSQFPVLQTPRELERATPCGRMWWPGRFRFNLNALKENGEAENVKRGYWRITRKGMERIGKADFRQKGVEISLFKEVKPMATKMLTVEIPEDIYDKFVQIVIRKGGPCRGNKQTAQKAIESAVESALIDFLKQFEKLSEGPEA